MTGSDDGLSSSGSCLIRVHGDFGSSDGPDNLGGY
jgi:hypothetical protein